MQTILMVASRAYDHREWLKANGFRFELSEWTKQTSSKREWDEVKAHAKGKFKISWRYPEYSAAEWSERLELVEQSERISSHRQLAGVPKVESEREHLSSDAFYVPGYSKIAATKPYAKYAQAPFTGNERGGLRMASDDLQNDDRT